MGKLADYIQKKFGVVTKMNVNPAGVTQIGTSLTTVLKNNPDRLMWMLINLGSYDAYIAWDRDVGTAHGVLLSARGGNLVLIADEDVELTGYEVYGIAPSGATDIYVIEVEAV